MKIMSYYTKVRHNSTFTQVAPTGCRFIETGSVFEQIIVGTVSLGLHSKPRKTEYIEDK